VENGEGGEEEGSWEGFAFSGCGSLSLLLRDSLCVLCVLCGERCWVGGIEMRNEFRAPGGMRCGMNSALRRGGFARRR